MADAAAPILALRRHKIARPAATSQMPATKASMCRMQKIYAQRFDGLMRGIECTPDDIQNASENSAQAIEPNPNLHLLISHSRFARNQTRRRRMYSRFQS